MRMLLRDAAQRQRLALVLLWVTPLIWSSNYIIARAATGVVSPHLLAFGRWTIALALLLTLTAASLIGKFALWRRELPQMLVLGGLGMWICGAFVYLGAHTTSATNIGLIYAATPVGIAVAGRWLLGESSTSAQRLAMLLALLGVLFVIAHGDPATLVSVRFTRGDIWIAIAAVSWVGYSVLLQYWKSSLNAAERLAGITAGGLVVLLPFTLAEAAGCWTSLPTAEFGWRARLLVVLAGVFPGFLAYQAYAFMLRELGVTRAALVMYLAPVFSAGTAWALLDEPPRWFHLVGAALILPSIYIATRRAGRVGG